MLYQTLPFSIQLNPSSFPPPPSFTSMDSVETIALKTSFLPEMSCKQTPQSFSEDIWCGNGTNDDLFVEGLLDFSNEQVIHQGDEEMKGVCCSSVSSLEEQNPYSSSEFVSVPGSELSVPMDDLASLEWVSQFVDDSFSEISLQHVPRKPEEKKQPVFTFHQSEPVSAWKPVTAFLTSVPAKARSKRSRTGGRVWSLGSLPIPLTESSSSSSSSYSSPSSSSSNSCLIFSQPGPGQNMDWFNFLGKPPPAKKVKRNHMTEESRRCSHCGVQKTPQWRTGPRGPKTLCNACGVRYKSGRLLPEYRPACSPTFSSRVHSNNHRKVLEMRRKKEVSLSDSELTQSY